MKVWSAKTKSTLNSPLTNLKLKSRETNVTWCFKTHFTCRHIKKNWRLNWTSRTCLKAKNGWRSVKRRSRGKKMCWVSEAERHRFTSDRSLGISLGLGFEIKAFCRIRKVRICFLKKSIQRGVGGTPHFSVRELINQNKKRRDRRSERGQRKSSLSELRRCRKMKVYQTEPVLRYRWTRWRRIFQGRHLR